ncbi:MAG: ABC transporter ATP-binding protein [Gammaproteobacteria bacterium]
MAALLAVRDLGIVFTTPENHPLPVVERVSFDLEAGAVLGLVGESGSGKTVTALAIMGLIAPPGRIAAGQVLFQGEDLLRKAPVELRRIRGVEIAMIFQEPMSALNPVFTIGQQISETLRYHRRLDRRAARRQAIAWLERVEIPAAARRFDAYPHELSGGMRQRAMIAMALACGPKLLIADEPTTALDVTIQAQILALLSQLQRDLGMAVLLITHDLGVVAEMADRVIVMYAGQMVEQASTGALFSRPHHPYSEGLLASIPPLDRDLERLAAIEGVVPNPTQWPSGCRFHPRCRYALAPCHALRPPLIAAAGPDHQVACIRHTGYRLPDSAAAEEVG